MPNGLLTQAGAMTLTPHPQYGYLESTALGPVTDSWTYSGFGEPETYTASVSGSPFLAVTYTRDKLGRITGKTETVQGVTRTFTYGYDLAGRLEWVQTDGVETARYTYDGNGNRLTYAGILGNAVGHYDDQDRMLDYGGATFTYTNNGELATKTEGSQVTTYDYDAFGNLRTVLLPDGTQIDYVIDGQNRRVGKKVNGVLVQAFLYQDQLEPVAELDGTGNLVSRFVYASRANTPDYLVKAGVTYRIISDHLGSPRLVIDTNTGAITQQLDYDEFGNVLLDTNPGFQPFGFAGGVDDRETGLIRFGARDYNSLQGRWTAKDPALFVAGLANFYSHLESDPVNLMDPSGLQSQVSQAYRLSNTLTTMKRRAPEPCQTYWERVWLNMDMVNSSIPGILAPPLMGLVTGSQVATAMDGIGVLKWAVSGFQGATLGGVAFTSIETGIIAAQTAAVNFMAVGLAYEGGVFIGSLINAAIMPCIPNVGR